jgi:hypothetical protein
MIKQVLFDPLPSRIVLSLILKLDKKLENENSKLLLKYNKLSSSFYNISGAFILMKNYLKTLIVKFQLEIHKSALPVKE